MTSIEREQGIEAANRLKAAVIGFGEVGGILATDLVAAHAAVSAFDTAPDARARARDAGFGAASVADACRGASMVFVCVTAGSVLEAMRSLAGSLEGSPFVVDVN